LEYFQIATAGLDNFPVAGRKDYPLLFDKDLKPKKAFLESNKKKPQ